MGEVLERPGRRAEVKVSRDELVMFEFEMAPEIDGAGPHFHKQHVDSFYVLEGELEMTVAGETCTRTRRPRSCRAGRRALVQERERERARFLNVHAPGMRFDEYIRRIDAGDKPTARVRPVPCLIKLAA